MAQFWDDWSDVPDGNYSSVSPPFRDWEFYTYSNYVSRYIESESSNPPPAPTGKTLRLVGSAVRRLRYTPVDVTTQDMSATMLTYQYQIYPTSSFTLHVRMGTDNTGYRLAYYGDQLVLLNSSGAVLDTAAAAGYQIAWHWLSLSAVGSNITGSLTLPDGTPITTVSATDSSASAGGVGISNTGNASCRIMGFGVGTDGDPAPMSAVVSAPERQRSRLILTPW